jgi:hypothetical protein
VKLCKSQFFSCLDSLLLIKLQLMPLPSQRLISSLVCAAMLGTIKVILNITDGLICKAKML